MTLHELTIAMENRDSVFYTDNDGNTVEAHIKSITDDGDVTIITWHGIRYKVSPEELFM